MYDFNVEDFMGRGGCSGDPNELACASLGYILNDLRNIKESYIKLGFHLSEFKRCAHYLSFGYGSLEHFAREKLGLDKSALSRCLNVFYEFADVQQDTRKMWIADKWKNYSYSQLCEMLPLSDEQRKQLKPDMTVEQIREIKKGKKKESVTTSQPDKIYLQPSDLDYGGIVTQNRVKAASSLGVVCIRAYDNNGKLIKDSPLFNRWVNLLMNKEDKIVVRFFNEVNTADDQDGNNACP